MDRFAELCAANEVSKHTYADAEPKDIVLRLAECLIAYVGGDWSYVERYTHTEPGRSGPTSDRLVKTPITYDERDPDGNVVCYLQLTLPKGDAFSFKVYAGPAKRRSVLVATAFEDKILVKQGAVRWDSFLALTYAKLLQMVHDTANRGSKPKPKPKS